MRALAIDYYTTHNTKALYVCESSFGNNLRSVRASFNVLAILRELAKRLRGYLAVNFLDSFLLLLIYTILFQTSRKRHENRQESTLRKIIWHLKKQKKVRLGLREIER